MAIHLFYFYKVGVNIIEFKNACKSYDNQSLALDDVSFTISDGEFVFIVGASGSGNSTLLKLLTKEEELTSGKIIINGDDITKLKKRKIPYLRRMMGVVFLDFRVIEKLTVLKMWHLLCI